MKYTIVFFLFALLTSNSQALMAQDIMESDTSAARPEDDIAGPSVFVPNAFTPDSDGLNTEFKPVLTEGYDPYDYHLIIFNREGAVVFESYDAAYGWDGTYGNIPLESNIYVWKLTFGDLETDKKHMHQGHVFLLK